MPNPGENRPAPWAWLAGICAFRIFSTGIALTFAAALPVLQAEWHLTASEAGIIQSAFQLGNAASLFTLSSLADVLGARRVVLWSGLGTAIAAFAFAAGAHGFWSALLLYGLVALFLGGNYTPVMQIIAREFTGRDLGRALGFFLAASSLGYSISLAATGTLIRLAGWRTAFYATAMGPLLGWLVAAAVLRRTAETERRPGRTGFSLYALRERPARLVMAGYVAHSWELLALWGWTPAFLAAALSLRGESLAQATGGGANLSALFMLVGGLGTTMGGYLSDRWGRTRVILLFLGTSVTCSFIFGWLVAAPTWVLVSIGLLYYFAGVGDSPVHSAGFAEVVEPRYLGSALALRSLLGFSAGAISPALFGMVLDLTNPSRPYAHWGWAYVLLGIGGLGGIWSTLLVRRLPESLKMAAGKR